MPATGDPQALAAADRPITRYPDITRNRIGGSHDHWRHGNHGRSPYNRRNRSCNHDRRRQRQAERKKEPNPGIGRQGGRSDQGGDDKQFDFHKFHCLIFMKVAA